MINKLERFVYDLVKKRPWLKDGLKYSYQFVFSLFTSKRPESKTQITTRENSYFGFHDKSPWSFCSTYLLGHEFEGVGNEPLCSGKAHNIVLFSGENWLKKEIIGSTKAWNWQQGSQLQWLGKSDNIIFNDFDDGKLISKVIDVKNKAEKKLSFPVAAVSPDGNKIASICFKTFGEAMPGYGYDFDQYGDKYKAYPERIVIIDLNNDKIKELNASPLPKSKLTGGEGINFVSHCLFSPCSNFLIFMKRKSIPGRRLLSEFYTLNINTWEFSRLPLKDMVSHYCFYDEETILVFGNTESEGDGFYTINIKTREINNVTLMINDRDGHPHSSGDFNRIVFDTYPNRKRKQNLYFLNKNIGSVEEIANLYAPFKFKGVNRVDLHPRVREDGKYVSFDSSFQGVRSLSTMRLDSE